jgi:hypothetical protein
MGHEGEMWEAMRWVAQAKDDLSAAQARRNTVATNFPARHLFGGSS